jgi:hypothetical protein
MLTGLEGQEAPLVRRRWGEGERLSVAGRVPRALQRVTNLYGTCNYSDPWASSCGVQLRLRPCRGSRAQLLSFLARQARDGLGQASLGDLNVVHLVPPRGRGLMGGSQIARHPCLCALAIPRRGNHTMRSRSLLSGSYMPPLPANYVPCAGLQMSPPVLLAAAAFDQDQPAVT